jgi:RNAse (barnase) inhibitor barstar
MTELRDLMPQLAKRLAEDFDFYHRSFDFLDVLGDYGTILDYLWDILFCPDTEPETKAVEVIKAFLNDNKKSATWLRDRLREIWDEYEKKTEGQGATIRIVPKDWPDDELPF